MQARESYYAALERQRVGEASVRSRFEQEKRSPMEEFEALESVYADVGMKAFNAFCNCLDWLSQLGNGRDRGNDAWREEFQTTLDETVVGTLREIQSEMTTVRERMGRLESSIAALEAGIRRIDKFTLEAFRNIQEIEERVKAEGGYNQDGARPLHGRLAKEEAASLALEAARAMQAQGRRLTLASVAREAGLKYGQIVYAFGNKEGFLAALRRDAQPKEELADHVSA